MIAGNVGAGGRVTYTIVGDAVNQAARLQVKTRDLGASILLTESTRAALGETNGLVLRPCGAARLKGVAAPVEVYAVEASTKTRSVTRDGGAVRTRRRLRFDPAPPSRAPPATAAR